MALPNMLNASTVYGNSYGVVLTTSSANVITNTTSQSIKVNNLLLCNSTATAATVTIAYYNSTAAASYNILYQTTVPANGSIDVFNRPFYLMENDKIQALAGTGSAIHLTASWEQVA